MSHLSYFYQKNGTYSFSYSKYEPDRQNGDRDRYPDRHLKNDRRSRSRSQLHDRRSFGRSFYLHKYAMSIS